MIVEIILIVLSIIALIIAIVFNMSKFGEEDRYIRISSAFAILLLSIFLGMLINTMITPTIEDYVRGKVRVEINQVYENGEVVRCDTNYYKL